MSPRTAGIVGLAGILGWAGLIWLGVQLYGTAPRTAAFDLELLLAAGRAVAAGQSPYDPALVAGSAPVAERLFYSYPPVVAQVLSVVAGVPSGVMFVLWSAAAVAGLGAVARALAVRVGTVSPNSVALTTIALAPLVFPFAVGLLFGNLNVFFPLAFGLVLLAVLPRSSSASALAGGSASALVAIAKLHPGSIVGWLIARSLTDRAVRPAAAAAVIVGLAVVGISVLIGGPASWVDYAAVIRAGSGADLVDPRNAGPAAQVALLVGGGGTAAEALARALQIPVALGAIGLTIVVALRVADSVESLAWAVAASLVVLPVTWYHYPSALIPFAIAALLRAGGSPDEARVRMLVAAAAVVAAIGIAFLPLIYVAIGLVLLAVRRSATRGVPA